MNDTRILSIIDDGNGKYIRAKLARPITFKNILPGQYVKLINGDDSQYFVVVEHDTDTLTFLMKRRLSFVDVLQPNMNLKMTDLMGGFRVDDVIGRTVICFAGGSGVAALTSVLKHISDTHDGISHCDLYYSESQDTFALNDVLTPMTNVCDIHRFKSEGSLRMYVEQSILGLIACFTGHMPIAFPTRPIVYICGSKDYAERLKKELVPRLVHLEDFRTNF